jgi:hypothetical protein
MTEEIKEKSVTIKNFNEIMRHMSSSWKYNVFYVYAFYITSQKIIYIKKFNGFF